MPRVRRKSASDVLNQANRIAALGGSIMEDRTRRNPSRNRWQGDRDVRSQVNRANEIADRYIDNIGRRQGANFSRGRGDWRTIDPNRRFSRRTYAGESRGTTNG